MGLKRSLRDAGKEGGEEKHGQVRVALLRSSSVPVMLRVPRSRSGGQRMSRAPAQSKRYPSDCLNRIYSIQWQFQRTAFKVLPHVIGAGCARKREHADLTRESEDNLGRRGILLRGKSRDGGMMENLP